MRLKDYQQDALDQLDRYLDALKKARLTGEKQSHALAEQGMEIPAELTDYPRIAWNKLKAKNALPAITQDGAPKIPAHITRTAASGAPIPHVCLKVPTGGGKTVLGVAALEQIKCDTGFVLWIVPSIAIYEQTLNAFRTREHPYRQMLERISGGKVKLLEKSTRFTKQDVENYLCVMMLRLPAMNRKRKPEFLKIFRDSGGYTSFFPELDDANANRDLLKKHTDLDKAAGGKWVKQSLINALKIIRPAVILDEAHKAYGAKIDENKEFVKTVNKLNPRFVLELSATPKIGISNILINISGRELHDEEMIKLPIEIHNLKNSDWKHTLDEAKAKLDQLAAEACKLQQRENRYVRPLALVRVKHTGDKMLDREIHADHARKYLIQNLAVPKSQIRIQSSTHKELEGEDLLSEESTVRWIITKNALQEGWDCAFAYVLALLDNTKAETAITQMVGRVMRQPHARRIEKSAALNQCAIFCYNQKVGDAVKGVKAGLENEGLTGLGEVVHEHGGEGAPEPVEIKPRAQYRKPKVFLPQVMHRAGRSWRLLDYHRDILSAIRWDKLDAGKAIDLDDEDTRRKVIILLGLQGQGERLDKDVDTGEKPRLEYFVRRLGDVPNAWQAARIANAFLQKHRRAGYDDTKIFANRMSLLKKLRKRVSNAIDAEAAHVFGGKVKSGAIKFDLKTDHELNKSFEVFVSKNARGLQGELAAPVQHSLFEQVYEGDFNGLERDFALYLDGKAAVKWWHKIAAQQGYKLQGWQRNRVLPDFVVSLDNGKLLVLETKGMHLSGNPDTTYKQTLLKKLEKAYECADDVGEYAHGKPSMAFRMLFENSWREDADKLIHKPT